MITSADSYVSEMPKNFCLEQNYPNPFNSSTRLVFRIPTSGFVSLKVYDLLGRQIAVLTNDFYVPGSYEVSFDGDGIASGIYFYRLEAPELMLTKKLVLQK